jgi:hypothetical protein
MADTRIALLGRTPDLASSIQSGFRLGAEIQDRPEQRKATELKVKELSREDAQQTAMAVYNALGADFDVNTISTDNISLLTDAANKGGAGIDINDDGVVDERDVQGMSALYTFGANAAANQLAASGGAGGSLPSSVKETMWFNQQPENIQKQHMDLKRRAELSSKDKLDYQQKLKDIELQFEKDKLDREYEAKFKNDPLLANAVEIARGVARDAAKVTTENRSNASALASYEAAIGGLTNSLDDTFTGPFLGWSPALTSNQQIVDGSIAVMAPVLKGIFRASGEGTFTKDDQEILMAMLPDRKDRPAARIAKLKQVDMVVRAKLKAKEIPTMEAKPKEITSQEEFDALPSGAVFIEDGVKQRKK